jgi:hypothetical protein
VDRAQVAIHLAQVRLARVVMRSWSVTCRP